MCIFLIPFSSFEYVKNNVTHRIGQVIFNRLTLLNNLLNFQISAISIIISRVVSVPVYIELDSRFDTNTVKRHVDR